MKYAERFQDIAVTQLNVDGFEQLTAQQKKLVYHLSQAGLWGRFISLDQGSAHNVKLLRTLVSLYRQLSQGHYARSEVLVKQVKDSLFTLFAHNGVYHSTTGEKLALPLVQGDFEELVENHPQFAQQVAELKSIWFSDCIKQWRTVQKDGVDGVQLSGSNFYDGLTNAEVQSWRKQNHPQPAAVAGNEQLAESDIPEVPPYGFNERLHKTPEGTIVRQTVFEGGLYGPYVQKIVEQLQLALDYAENDAQRLSISTLIDFYKSGTAEDFDKHCVAWTKDQDSDIYFINGLIESYDDPLGVCCGFESIVAFKNPLQTAKVKKIIENIQWFEDSMPFDPRFKKTEATGLSASSITVVSMAGETSPSLPLGINLPNSDWIRAKHGSKSVNLENSATSRSAFEKPLREALYLPKYQGIMEKYLGVTNGLIVDLHEIAGHGSGKLLPGVSGEALGQYYSIIEECRADLAALYFIADKKLQDFGIFDSDVDVEEAARAQYVAYLTNGLFGQLRRIQPGQPLTQAHMRNRQIIAKWVLGMATEQVARTVTVDGKLYVEVRNVAGMRQLFGKLLGIIQKSKSEGEYDTARTLVVKFGTDVHQPLLEQMHQRIEGLDMPKTVCFVTPSWTIDGDTVSVTQPTNFFKEQLALFDEFCSLPD